MKRSFRKASTLAVSMALTVAAIGLAAGPASGAGSNVLTKGQVRKALLTVKQISAASGVGSASAADALVCHSAPYTTGSVNYCYYEYLHSDPAFAAGKAWPNHVDLLGFDSAKTARTYLKEMKASRPATAILSQTSTSVMFYDTDLPITTAAAVGAQPQQVKGPTVTIFSARGANVAYIACADPKATDSKALAACATALAKAQLAKLG
jgi:hypothetical protein